MNRCAARSARCGALTDEERLMKKQAKRLTLNRESLGRLDAAHRVVAGYALTPACSVVQTCPLSYCTCPAPTGKCTEGIC
jgi:hypothetical protein